MEPAPQVLNADNSLLAPTDTVVSIKAVEFKTIEFLAKSSLRMLSYIEHFGGASTKLLWQPLEEVKQSNQESGHPVPRCYSTSSCHRRGPSLKPRF